MGVARSEGVDCAVLLPPSALPEGAAEGVVETEAHADREGGGEPEPPAVGDAVGENETGADALGEAGGVREGEGEVPLRPPGKRSTPARCSTRDPAQGAASNRGEKLRAGRSSSPWRGT